MDWLLISVVEQINVMHAVSCREGQDKSVWAEFGKLS